MSLLLSKPKAYLIPFHMKTFEEQVHADVQRTLEEDVGTGDLTAALIPADRKAVATIICRESAVICGRPLSLIHI